MNEYDWPIEFRKAHAAGTERYLKGERNPEPIFTPAEKKFLLSIGCTPQEMYDFVDDLQRYGEPAFETALLMTAVRREYFLFVQKGKWSGKTISMDDLPSKKAEVEGIAWLPRLIEKAKAKLRGEMPADLMYGCGGDRPFLREMKTELSDFLRMVWLSNGDDRRVIDFVKRNAGLLT
jgi:hypothetical protein